MKKAGDRSIESTGFFYGPDSVERMKNNLQGQCGRVGPAPRQDDFYKYDREDSMQFGIWPNDDDGRMGADWVEGDNF